MAARIAEVSPGFTIAFARRTLPYRREEDRALYLEMLARTGLPEGVRSAVPAAPFALQVPYVPAGRGRTLKTRPAVLRTGYYPRSREELPRCW